MKRDKEKEYLMKNEDEPSVAPGIDDDEELNQNASKEDIK